MKIYKIQIRILGKWNTKTVEEMSFEDAANAMFDALQNDEIAQVGRVSRMVGIGQWQEEFLANREGEYIGVG